MCKNKKNVYVISELGINHNGSLKTAKELIRLSKSAGANAVKIQSYITDNVVVKNLSLAPYQKKNLKNKKKLNMYNMIKKYELDFSSQLKLYEYSKRINIDFISSPFDLDSAVFLVEKLKLNLIKIASGEITNYPLLNYLSKHKVNVILSTGMSKIKEISAAINLLKSRKRIKKISLLHCNTDYPTKYEDMNLLAIKLLKKKFKLQVGLSDHSIDYKSSIYAVSLGAEIIEKHVTLDKKMTGPDHKASINIKELKSLINEINIYKKILGKKIKKVTGSEKKNINFARKYIVAKKEIKKGEFFSYTNLTTKRSFKGISPMLMPKLHKKVKANRKYNKDDAIERSNL